MINGTSCHPEQQPATSTVCPDHGYRRLHRGVIEQHLRGMPHRRRSVPIRYLVDQANGGNMGVGKATDRAEVIAAVNAAARSQRWQEAFDALSSTDVAAPFDPDDVDALGWAAHFTARPDEAIAARQRAFAAVRVTERRRAAQIAVLGRGRV